MLSVVPASCLSVNQSRDVWKAACVYSTVHNLTSKPHTLKPCVRVCVCRCCLLQGFTECCEVLAAAQPLQSVRHRLWSGVAVPPLRPVLPLQGCCAGGHVLCWRHGVQDR